MSSIFKNVWFRDCNEHSLYINEVAVRIRAGILLIIPLFVGLTLYDVLYTSSWVVDGNSIVDQYETDWEGRTVYAAQVVKRTYEYSTQTWVLFYGLFEMLAGMFVFSARFSPAILISTYLSRNTQPIWKPLQPKRFAWSIGASIILACILYFNPDVFATWVNVLFGGELLPVTQNYMPRWIPSLVWVCIVFMWLEATLGFCAGCKVHSLLVKIGVIKEECLACNNINWKNVTETPKS
jgi:hypothetical protein